MLLISRFLQLTASYELKEIESMTNGIVAAWLEILIYQSTKLMISEF